MNGGKSFSWSMMARSVTLKCQTLPRAEDDLPLPPRVRSPSHDLINKPPWLNFWISPSRKPSDVTRWVTP